MKKHSEPSIDIVAASLDEHERRPVSPTAGVPPEISDLADTVRIERTPRAETTQREMLNQPFSDD